MKKQNILLVCALLIAALGMAACGGGKNCKGGGWYGDRNLTSVDVKESPVNDTNTKEIETTNCEAVNP